MKINKSQFQLSRRDKISFNIKRGKGCFIPFLINRFKWHYYPRLHHVSKFPDHVDIEISSICNMNCKMCYTTTDEFKERVPRKLMSMTLFRKIIDECAKYKTFSIRLSLRGEPFIHKDIVNMITYANEKGIKEISLLTNGYKITPEIFRQCIVAGLSWITLSIDGVFETYENIRYPMKFEQIVRNLNEFKKIKEDIGTIKPIIKIQSVLPAIEGDADIYYNIFKPYVDAIASNPLIDYLSNDDDIEYIENFDCPVLYQRLVIGSDGSILICSNDELNDCIIGDANIDSLHDVWHGEHFTAMRNAHNAGVGYKNKPCDVCYLPRKTKVTKTQIGGRSIKVHKYMNRSDVIGE